MSNELHHFSCPPPPMGQINFETIQAARLGKLEKIRSYLLEGGDVNSADASGCTMIFAACQQGRIDVLEELLKQPNIHLNVRHMGITPLTIAAIHGHETCIKALLASNLQCRVNLHIQSAVKNNIMSSVLGAAAVSKNWKIFSILLERINEIVDFDTIFVNVLHADQWYIMQDILKKNLSWEGAIYYKILKESYLRELWDIVDEIFRKAILHENYSVLNILKDMYSRRDWKRLESLLQILCESVKIDVGFSEALQSKRNQEVERLIKQRKVDKGTMCGGLFVATLSGTSENVAELFLKKMNDDYSEEALKFALILATMYNRMEFVPLLIHKGRFSYKTLGVARSMADNFESMESVKLLKLAFSNKAYKLFPEVQKLMCNDVEKILINDVENDDE
ncbi:hypothetical protein SK128_003347 [Halocaridina rubra]|uniref:Ankyrin repeat protein n=1 Tax=Halocaridina rubra TaxID=373956 RepID=A0AAN8XA42_HALRR